MYKEDLEIRGIHRENILDYVQQLGGVDQQDVDQDVFTSEQWTCIVASEKYFRLFQSDIPVVFVTFQAEEQQILAEVIRKFRLKTFRAGG